MKIDESVSCPLCVFQTNSVDSLTRHWSRTHKQTSKELYLKLNSLTQEPTCECGCGESVMFFNAVKGFGKYKRGHTQRIPGKNNWGHNETAQQHSIDTRKRMLETGEWKPWISNETGERWNKGLTKDTDNRIKLVSNAIKNDPFECQKRSERMRKNRLTGVVQTLYGPDHPQWKGGISPLKVYCNLNPRLYKDWKYPIMQQSGFKCSNCGDLRALQVHHNGERFSDIVDKFIVRYKWTHNRSESLEPNNTELIELKSIISEAVADYHINNNVSGIVLCEQCHKQEHANLNF